ncbi:hypothetical protein F0562_004541 [Nyssa sinensis]|uniref:Uncharacterized protein n=1 Tax=Nyssa sinensis TaxID=561372 RepID=A0A5J5BZ02_9ASTE|nr:hypothetical protein F0562_004541 [Nyssa sinensis]
MRRKRLCQNYVDRALRHSNTERQKVRDELLNQLKTNERCRDIIRMGPEAFENLCNILKKDGGLQPTKRTTIEEQVVNFLHIVSHNVKNRTIQFFFRRSGETISRHFHNVLRSIISLEDTFLQQPDGSEIPPEIVFNSRFYPYFKNCIGAIDGTHVRVKVSNEDAPRYRGRKNYPTQNVLAACSFDLRFTYILPGWEGTAADSRIIKNALTRDDNLKIPNRQNLRIEKWRTTPINHYDKLCEMFAKDTATGAGAETAKEKRRRWVSSTSEDPLESIHNIDQLVSQNEVTLENFICDLDDDVENITSPKAPSSVPSQSATSKKKNKKMRYDDEKDVQMVKAIESVAEAIKEGNAIYEKYHQPVYSEKEVYNELTAIRVQEFLLDDAYLYLTSHPDKMRQFLGCPFERRKGILERMMQS